MNQTKHDHPKRVIILGSTGSIGISTLSVCAAFPDRFPVAALSAHTSEETLLEQAQRFGVPVLALSGAKPKDTRIRFSGSEGLLAMISETEAEIVVNGISGAVGLLPSREALRSGKDLALANKETMVMAGPLVTELARAGGRRIIPVDSEHSAIFFLLQGKEPDQVERLVLTASGGAFRTLPLERLCSVTKEQALSHPTWKMGPKITVDSATMANKGLEVMEAQYLFGFSPDRIDVIIHPQSRVHSLVRMADGSLHAHIGEPDMRLPILAALSYPEMVPSPFGRLDLPGTVMEFLEPEKARYPLLFTAIQAAETGAGYPAAFNGANETAVSRFLEGKIGFTDIAGAVAETLEADWHNQVHSFEDAIEIDRRARIAAEKVITRRIAAL